MFSELTSAPVSLLISNSSGIEFLLIIYRNCCFLPHISAHVAVGGGSGQQGVGPECLCDIRDCLDSCDSCTTGAGGDGDQCHSVLSLLLIRSHGQPVPLACTLLVFCTYTICSA